MDNENSIPASDSSKSSLNSTANTKIDKSDAKVEIIDSSKKILESDKKLIFEKHTRAKRSQDAGETSEPIDLTTPRSVEEGKSMPSTSNSKDSSACDSTDKDLAPIDSTRLPKRVRKSTPKSELDKDTDSSDSKPEEKKFPPTPDGPRPVHKWSLTNAVLRRQYGSTSRQSPNNFVHDCYGSLHVVERLELMYKMKKHDGCVNTINFNSKGTRLVSGSDDLDITIWDWLQNEPKFTFNSGHRNNVFQAKFMPLSNDHKIVSCAQDGQVRLADLMILDESQITKKLAQHKGAAHKLALQNDSPDIFLTCGEDAIVYQIDLRDSTPEKLLTCRENDGKVPLYAVSINPMKPYEYVICGCDEFVRVYDKRFTSGHDRERVLKKYCPAHLNATQQKANVTCVAYSYNGEQILASYNDEDIYLFDSYATNTSEYLHHYGGHRNSQTVKGVNFFGSKSEFITSGSDCGYVFFWDKETEHVVRYMHGDENGVVNCLEPNPVMPVLATSGLDDDIKIWVPSCEEPPDLSGLEDHIKRNFKERDDEKKCESAPHDFQIIRFLMHQLRQARQRNLSGDVNDDDTSSSSNSDVDFDSSEYQSSVQCSQS